MALARVVVVVIAVAGSHAAASAGPVPARAGATPKSCPAWRPCGPGNTWGGNRLLPQGARGVDFRPACQRHDDCYDTPGARRKDCDRQFLADMRALCAAAGDPRGCARRARMYYIAVRLFGGASTTG